MKKRVLGIIGSYRKLGNSEIVVKAVGQKLRAGWELSLVRLPALSILPCKGCYACLLPGQACRLEDDVQWLLDRIEESDAVMVAAPNYVLGPVGIVKMLTDRALQAVGRLKSFNDKRTAVALTLGREEWRGYADTAIASQIRGLGLKIVSLESFLGTHPGEAALADDFHEKAGRMARALMGEGAAPVADNRCPQCHSDIFRVHPEGLECAVCRSRASYKEGSLRFHHLSDMFSLEGREEHAEWLLMMKHEYPEIREKRLKIRDSYRGGSWISPRQ
jgi:multimeric flavodoxin WrbA